ncbi:MAG TPA: hypothetical protein VGQ38_04070, partial [Gaiellaceae bacterium]|nr:hypothetical protein [Gaiellaceae bacterium]
MTKRLATLCASAIAAVAFGAAHAGTTALPAAELPSQSSLASQRIYFVMPDRYANGDTSNDTGGL